ncbi:MAG: LPXTG cell wall anchor domain-containing protein [Pleurocapsa sp. MO_226.B13]|nr:LPXTG cell wall anchor domain-containing protein [Pleurocapsa sp. MO_226.B13]
MRYNAMFSVGDYNLADFAAKYDFSPKGYKPIHYNPMAAGNQPGVRKGHIRNVGGKAVMVGQSLLKAGKSTAGRLAAGAAGVGTAGMAAGKKYGGQALNVVKSNPKTAALAAGGTLLAGGAAGYLATRKKRKRR